ncbi:MAG: sugar transferase [Spirochaetota bacterium]
MKLQRFFDIFLAILGLILFSPVLLTASVWIYFELRQGFCFVQQRVGKDGVLFSIYKFKTMLEGKVTRSGAFLRKTGLDEILQFYNVLKGEMSIVGPRPLLASDLQRLGWEQNFPERYSIRPGITGLAQLYAGSHVKISRFLDNYYLANQSYLLYCKIICISFLMNVLGKAKVRTYLYKRWQNRKSDFAWKHWYQKFAARSKRTFPKPFLEEELLPAEKRQAICSSLAIFQLGESGEGRVAREIDETEFFGIDRYYRKSLGLFVREESRHAALLKLCIKAFSGEVLLRSQQERAFQFLRRLLGVRLKLFILSAAEVVGIVFYRNYAEKLPLSQTKAILREIVSDEELHLQFHMELFTKMIANSCLREAFFFFWRSFVFCSLLAVYCLHYKYLREFSIRWSVVYQQYLKQCRVVAVFLRNKNGELWQVDKVRML